VSAPFSVLGHFKNQNLDVSNFKDDQSAVDHLLQLARNAQQVQHLAQHGQRYQQHATQFESWLAQQQKAQQTQAPTESWWKAPEWNDAWLSQVDVDANGNYVPKPGAPPDVGQKIAAFRNHQREFLNKFASDPMGAVGPGIKEMVQKEAMALIQQHLGAYQEDTVAHQIIQQNRSWMVQQDAQGRALLDPISQQPAWTPEALMYRQYVEQLSQAGVRDSRAQDHMARQLVAGQVAMRGFGSQAATTANDVKKADFLNGAARLPSHSGTMATPGLPQNEKLTLEQMLKQNFRAAGISDADFRS
jgi:hypothetical protein